MGLPILDIVENATRAGATRVEIATERAADLAQQWREGGDVNTLAETFNGTVSQARDHRWGAPVGTIGSTAGIDEAVAGGASPRVSNHVFTYGLRKPAATARPTTRTRLAFIRRSFPSVHSRSRSPLGSPDGEKSWQSP